MHYHLPCKMFVTDYDGTLASTSGFVSLANIDALERLGEKGIVRVIATGRSLFSLFQVIDFTFPVDYVIFSSGLGIINLKTKKIRSKSTLEKSDTKLIMKWLSQNGYNFMLHKAPPDNHRFYAYTAEYEHDDFQRRLAHYMRLDVKLLVDPPELASQFVVICNDDEGHFQHIQSAFNNFKVIRTTSPFDGISLWVEIFPYDVSKAHGITEICNELSIESKNVHVVGNDFNDSDMLEWSVNSFVVENGSEALKQIYTVIPSNTDNGIAFLINNLLANTV